jgi:hypothetical protein
VATLSPGMPPVTSTGPDAYKKWNFVNPTTSASAIYVAPLDDETDP